MKTTREVSPPSIDRWPWTHLGQFRESLVDENEGDEEGEDLLGEAWDKAHQKTALEGHGDNHNEDQPEPDPHTAGQVLHIVGLAELTLHRKQITSQSVVISTIMDTIVVIFIVTDRVVGLFEDQQGTRKTHDQKRLSPQ